LAKKNKRLFFLLILITKKLVDPAGCPYAPLAQRLSHASGNNPTV
jgi:hypothetical protein